MNDDLISRAAVMVDLQSIRIFIEEGYVIDLDESIATIEAIPAANIWQPIATAPKDGTYYLCWSHEYGPRVANCPTGCSPGYWTIRLPEIDDWTGGCGSYAENATHWHPLPALPDNGQ